MENIVTSWRKRNLSLNGRMLAAKTFLLSQIVFQAQVVDIAVKEVKKIERLIYSFVNGAKSLYGPERVARHRLKATKEQGGINGVDVASFIRAIQIRQFNKAGKGHGKLRTLQRSFKGFDDDLNRSASAFLRSHYRAALAEGIPDLQQITQISSIPLKILLTPDTRAYSYASTLMPSSLYELQRAIMNNRIPRPQVNAILKQLPAMIRLLIRGNSLVDNRPSILISLDNYSLVPVEQLSAANLRRRILNFKQLIGPVRAKEVYKEPLWNEPGDWQSKLWKIKNPHLRGYRLKLLYKDIFSNERRFRFKLADSPNCTICGQVETVAHQLFECQNAKKLWGMYRSITGKNVGSMLDVIICCEDIEVEIVKSIIIKRLIQIDRSNSIVYASLKQEVKHYYQIEAGASSTATVQFWKSCVARIDRL